MKTGLRLGWTLVVGALVYIGLLACGASGDTVQNFKDDCASQGGRVSAVRVEGETQYSCTRDGAVIATMKW